MADLHLLKQMCLERNIVGVTCILNEVYVITENCDTVDVFCHRSYELKNSVSIADMHPTDIATSYADVCVYVLDGNNVCVWRIHRALKTTAKYPLNVSSGAVMKSMSITKKGVIVVVLSGNTIVMYNPSNGEKKDVLLEGVGFLECATSVAHATEIGDNRLLACNDRQTFVYDLEREEVRRDMVIDVGGNHITLKNSKCAIITDRTGQRVRTLDIEKWETKDIPVADGRNGTNLISPTHAHYAMENGLLLVTGRKYLNVYSFDKIDVESHLADSETRQGPERQASLSDDGVRQSERHDELAEKNDETAAAADKLSFKRQSANNDDDDEVRMIIQRLSTKYKGQFYYDMKDKKVHIAVHEDVKPFVEKEMEDWKCKTSFEYQMEKPVESQCSMSLGPGSRIFSPVYFMFSGTMIDESTGVTVAHGANAGSDVMIMTRENVPQIIGRCLAAIREVQVTTFRSEYTLTADMAVLDLRPQFHVRRNFVQWANREFRVKIYRGSRVPENTEVMILDWNGTFQHGVIRRESFTDTDLEMRQMNNLYGVLGIGTEVRTEAGMLQSAITQHGDSGALVLSLPEERDDAEDGVLYVYGIVIGLYYWEQSGLKSSLTVANSLGRVTPEVFSNQDVVNRVGNIPVDDIDFTQMADLQVQ